MGVLFLIHILLIQQATASDCNIQHFVQNILESKHPSLIKAEALIEKQKTPLTRHVLFDSPHHGETIEVLGVPKSVIFYPFHDDEIFRYYTRDELVEKILASKSLQSGHLPYVITEPGIKKEYYYDLEGTFLTKPDFNPQSIGLENNPNMSYVDFTIPKNLGLLKIEPGIFLIPGKPKFQTWILNEFEKFKKTNASEYPAQYEKVFKRIENYASEAESTNPIIIREYRKNGVIKKITASSPLLNQLLPIKQEILKGYHLPTNYTSAYYARRIEPYLSKPAYQEVKDPAALFRGMYRTPEELEDILKNGMRLDKVKWTTAGGGISFSSNINEAASYIFQSANSRPNGMGVVFKVKKTDAMKMADDPVLNATHTIYKLHSDLRADEIEKIYLWGEHGLESLEEVVDKATKGKITPHSEWTNAFESGFSR